jgi:hypothetical protein
LIKVGTGVYHENIRIQNAINGLVIEGGWYGSQFEYRDENPFSTRIDGDGVDTVLTASLANGASIDAKIDGLTLQNGDSARGGALQIRAWSDESLEMEFVNCVFQNNTASSGGGICVESMGSNSLAGICIRKSRLASNSSARGGAIYIGSDGPGETEASVSDSIISNNEAVDYPGSGLLGGSGGGLFITATRGGVTNASFTNNLICDNHGDYEAVYVDAAYPYTEHASTTVRLTNNTITSNYRRGISVSAYTGSTRMYITNSIIWGNVAGDLNIVDGDLIVNADHSIIGEVDNIGGTYNEGSGVLNSDPLFVDPSQEDYHLRRLSPAVDTGICWRYFPYPPVRIAPYNDFEGDARPSAGTFGCDMGADEYVPYERFVSTTGTDSGNDCSDPLSPCASVTHAVEAAILGNGSYKNDIKVSQGVYNNENLLIDSLKKISITGGWNTDFSSRSRDASLTLLDGGQTTSGLCLDMQDTDIEFRLEGFTIRNGSASGGGGIHILSRNSAVRALFMNNIIRQNNANYGGGVSVYSADSPSGKKDIISFYNTIVADNTAEYGGGGFYIDTSHSPVYLDLHQSTIASNHANNYGGGIVLLENGGTSLIRSNIKGSIVWMNTYGQNSYEDDIRTYSSTGSLVVNASYSDIGSVTLFGGIYTDDPTNIEQDPCFVESAVGNSHLRRNSPAIDKGICTGPPFDYEGETRPQGTGCDMGADEFLPKAAAMPWIPLLLLDE